MVFKTVIGGLLLILLIILNGCMDNRDKPHFKTYFVVTQIDPIPKETENLTVEFETDTVFPVKQDDHPDEDKYKTMEVSFKGVSYPAELLDTETVTRGGSEYAEEGIETSYIKKSWQSSLPKISDLEDGKYLMIFSGCNNSKQNCKHIPIPVCVKDNIILGQPTGRNNRPESKSYLHAINSNDPSNLKNWNKNVTCANPVWGETGTLNLDTKPPGQILPEDWSAKIGS
jgi:hypothetical protein